MRHIETEFVPLYIVRFKDSEVSLLHQCAMNHYDYSCKAMAKPGGLLYGLLNSLAVNQESKEEVCTVRVAIKRSQVQLLLKALELAPLNNISGSLRQLLKIQSKFETSFNP